MESKLQQQQERSLGQETAMAASPTLWSQLIGALDLTRLRDNLLGGAKGRLTSMGFQKNGNIQQGVGGHGGKKN